MKSDPIFDTIYNQHFSAIANQCIYILLLCLYMVVFVGCGPMSLPFPCWIQITNYNTRDRE